MQIKSTSVRLSAALGAAILTLASPLQAGPMSGMRVIDAPGQASAAIAGNNTRSSGANSARTNRGGADDPANHDAGDNHGQHRGRGRH